MSAQRKTTTLRAAELVFGVRLQINRFITQSHTTRLSHYAVRVWATPAKTRPLKHTVYGPLFNLTFGLMCLTALAQWWRGPVSSAAASPDAHAPLHPSEASSTNARSRVVTSPSPRTADLQHRARAAAAADERALADATRGMPARRASSPSRPRAATPTAKPPPAFAGRGHSLVPRAAAARVLDPAAGSAVPAPATAGCSDSGSAGAHAPAASPSSAAQARDARARAAERRAAPRAKLVATSDDGAALDAAILKDIVGSS